MLSFFSRLMIFNQPGRASCEQSCTAERRCEGSIFCGSDILVVPREMTTVWSSPHKSAFVNAWLLLN
jgi:hypothetical protein